MTDTNNNQPATKGDLAVLKTDITNLRVELKTDIQRLDQKIGQMDQKIGQMDQKIGQLDKTVISLAIELTKTQTDVREIKYNMATNMATKDDVSRLITHIDAFAAEAISHRNHDTLRGGKVMEHESKLENHESRITLLETTK